MVFGDVILGVGSWERGIFVEVIALVSSRRSL